ncbi:MAG TPA: LptF/LptG family permease [Candidatus Eisenbacteria bacterium]
MKILDRYVLREFLGYLLLGLLGFIVIFVVVDLFEKIDVFLDHRAPLGLVARFYLYRAPEVVVLALPVALLLATFLALGQLNKFGELTAMRAAGLPLLTILRPVFGVAAGATVVALLLGEVVVPGASRERDRIYDEQIQRVRRDVATERADVTYLGAGGRTYLIRLYLVREQRMHEVQVLEYAGGRLAGRIDAAEAAWDGTQWVFTSGWVRRFESGGRERAEPFQRLEAPQLPERPRDFAKDSVEPGEMDFIQLRGYIAKLRASGLRVAKYLVDLHLKLSFPLFNLIVVMIGASVATRLRLQSAALGFGFSVIIAFVYWGFMQLGKALGHSGLVSPYLAAWMGDALFGAAGVVLLAQAQRR